MKIIRGLSHCDHVSEALLAYVESRFRDRQGFFVECIMLPPDLAVGLTSALYGPMCGDPPVTDDMVYYACLIGRERPSRLIDLEPRPTNLLTVIAVPHEEHACILHTVFGGHASPKEVNDPSLALATPADRERSAEFWAAHALARPIQQPCRYCRGDEAAHACECV